MAVRKKKKLCLLIPFFKTYLCFKIKVKAGSPESQRVATPTLLKWCGSLRLRLRNLSLGGSNLVIWFARQYSTIGANACFAWSNWYSMLKYSNYFTMPPKFDWKKFIYVSFWYDCRKLEFCQCYFWVFNFCSIWKQDPAKRKAGYRISGWYTVMADTRYPAGFSA
jgi:hypothetical protein